MAAKSVFKKEETGPDKKAELLGTLRDKRSEWIIEGEEGVTLKRGQKSKVYYDFKKAAGDPKILKLAADAMWEQMDHKITAIVASGHGGVPIATVIAANHKLRLILLEETPDKRLVNYPLAADEELNAFKKDILMGVTVIAAAGYPGIVAATLISQKYGVKMMLVREKPKGHGKRSMLDGYVPRKNLTESFANENNEVVEPVEEAIELICNKSLTDAEKDALTGTINAETEARCFIGSTIDRSLLMPRLKMTSSRESFHEEVWVVDDVASTGGSLEECAKFVEALGGKVKGCSAVIKRGDFELRRKFTYLATPEDILHG